MKSMKDSAMELLLDLRAKYSSDLYVQGLKSESGDLCGNESVVEHLQHTLFEIERHIEWLNKAVVIDSDKIGKGITFSSDTEGYNQIQGEFVPDYRSVEECDHGVNLNSRCVKCQQAAYEERQKNKE